MPEQFDLFAIKNIIDAFEGRKPELTPSHFFMEHENETYKVSGLINVPCIVMVRDAKVSIFATTRGTLVSLTYPVKGRLESGPMKRYSDLMIDFVFKARGQGW